MDATPVADASAKEPSSNATPPRPEAPAAPGRPLTSTSAEVGEVRVADSTVAPSQSAVARSVDVPSCSAKGTSLSTRSRAEAAAGSTGSSTTSRARGLSASAGRAESSQAPSSRSQ